MDVNDQLITMIHQQLEQQKAQHQQQMEMLQKQMEAERRESKEQMKELIEKLSNRKPDAKEALFDRLRQRIEKFTYDPEEGRFFDLWLKRFEDTIQGHDDDLPENLRTELLRTLLDTSTYSTFSIRIAPSLPNELTWKDTISTLRKLFGLKKSLFRLRFEFNRIVCGPGGDFSSYGNKIIASAEAAKLKEMNEETIKCLQYVSGLKASEYIEIRSRLLQRLDEDKPVTLVDLIAQSEAIKATIDDAKSIEETHVEIQAVHKPRISYTRPMSPNHQRDPPAPCPICRGSHWKRECPSFKSHKYSEPQRIRERQYSTERQKFIGNINIDSGVKRFH